METLIYKHYLYDAWMADMFSIEVHDTKENNVICIYYAMSPFSKVLPMMKKYTIDEVSLEKIKQIISKYSEVLFVNEYDIDKPYMILDGVINVFTYRLGDNRNKLEISNVQGFADYEGYIGNKILDAHHEITKVLEKEDVDKYFLGLDIE